MKSPKPSAEAEPKSQPGTFLQAIKTRRSFFSRLGTGAVLAALGSQGYALLRSLVPNVLYEEPQRLKVGPPDQFPEGATYLEDHRLFLIRERNTLYSISAVCTHLGCTVKMLSLTQPKRVRIDGQWIEERREFHCPCHGSKYYGDGTNYSGPAPRPLARYKLEVSPDDGQLIVDFSQPENQNFRLTV
jgi:menaquinol-cytochrome c reductase iron-sulfur subunit